MQQSLGVFGACIALLLASAANAPQRASAGDMDPSLSRLVHAAGDEGCPETGEATLCPDHGAFEHLVSELAGGLAPPIAAGAATDGARGFYVGLSSTATTLRGDSRYWARGTRGDDPAQRENADVAKLLVWNRLDVRKGLPFGLEVGSSVGFGAETSLWVVSGQLKLALFEGFRSGLGALPDVAIRVVTQHVIGAADLSLQTYATDLTVSKPFVLLQEHVLTPLLALQLLFLSAKSGVVDLTPASDAFAACAPERGAPNGLDLQCTGGSGRVELAENVRFRSVSHTRARLVVGAEERFRLLSIALTLGFDLTAPGLHADTPSGELPSQLLRQFSLHVAGGLRY
ncbi:MAG: hypothetical protein ABW321_13420 [Polyangiales bacterium]